MKTKIKILLIAMTFSVGAKAAVLTVNNAPAGGAQYAQINAAITAANAGDTIYVSGSSNSYADGVITKSITIIGPGSYNQTAMQLPASINMINLSSNISNVTISGMWILSNLNVSGLSNVHNFLLSNCRIVNGILLGGTTNSSDFIFRNNIFTNHIGISITGGSNTGCFNFLIDNNIIGCALDGLNITGTLVQNNTFYNPLVNGSSPVAFFNPCSGFILNNNIFYNADPSANATGCVYNNNITYSTGSTYTALGGTNIDNANPLFVNAATSGGFNISYDFSLQTASPAHNAGSDGTDMGYYGGGRKVTETGEIENIPVIRAMNVQNTNVLQGGNVNVKVRSTKARTN